MKQKLQAEFLLFFFFIVPSFSEIGKMFENNTNLPF